MQVEDQQLKLFLLDFGLIAKKDINDWNSNPYVWVIEYERIEYQK